MALGKLRSTQVAGFSTFCLIRRIAQLPAVRIHIVAAVGGCRGEAAAEAARAAAVGRNVRLPAELRRQLGAIEVGVVAGDREGGGEAAAEAAGAAAAGRHQRLVAGGQGRLCAELAPKFKFE